MTRPVLTALVLASAIAALGSTPAQAADQHVSCSSFVHRGYVASNLRGTTLTCHAVRLYAAHVIEHGTGALAQEGWLCFESTSTDGSGSAGCHNTTSHG